MAVVIIVAVFLATRYRQSNYTPPESTVTVTPPPPVEQPLPPPPPVEQPPPPPPVEQPPPPPPVEQPPPTGPTNVEINGIGGFDKIAGETMYEYQSMVTPETPQMMTPDTPQMVTPETPQMVTPEASVTSPQVEMYMKSPYAEL